MSASVAMALWVAGALYFGLGFAIAWSAAVQVTLEGDRFSILRALAVIAIWPVFFVGGGE